MLIRSSWDGDVLLQPCVFKAEKKIAVRSGAAAAAAVPGGKKGQKKMLAQAIATAAAAGGIGMDDGCGLSLVDTRGLVPELVVGEFTDHQQEQQQQHVTGACTADAATGDERIPGWMNRDAPATATTVAADNGMHATSVSSCFLELDAWLDDVIDPPVYITERLFSTNVAAVRRSGRAQEKRKYAQLPLHAALAEQAARSAGDKRLQERGEGEDEKQLQQQLRREKEQQGQEVGVGMDCEQQTHQQQQTAEEQQQGQVRVRGEESWGSLVQKATAGFPSAGGKGGWCRTWALSSQPAAAGSLGWYRIDVLPPPDGRHVGTTIGASGSTSTAAAAERKNGAGAKAQSSFREAKEGLHGVAASDGMDEVSDFFSAAVPEEKELQGLLANTAVPMTLLEIWHSLQLRYLQQQRGEKGAAGGVASKSQQQQQGEGLDGMWGNQGARKRKSAGAAFGGGRGRRGGRGKGRMAEITADEEELCNEEGEGGGLGGQQQQEGHGGDGRQEARGRSRGNGRGIVGRGRGRGRRGSAAAEGLGQNGADDSDADFHEEEEGVVVKDQMARRIERLTKRRKLLEKKEAAVADGKQHLVGGSAVPGQRKASKLVEFSQIREKQRQQRLQQQGAAARGRQQEEEAGPSGQIPQQEEQQQGVTAGNKGQQRQGGSSEQVEQLEQQQQQHGEQGEEGGELLQRRAAGSGQRQQRQEQLRQQQEAKAAQLKEWWRRLEQKKLAPAVELSARLLLAGAAATTALHPSRDLRNHQQGAADSMSEHTAAAAAADRAAGNQKSKVEAGGSAEQGQQNSASAASAAAGLSSGAGEALLLLLHRVQDSLEHQQQQQQGLMEGEAGTAELATAGAVKGAAAAATASVRAGLRPLQLCCYSSPSALAAAFSGTTLPAAAVKANLTNYQEQSLQQQQQGGLGTLGHGGERGVQQQQRQKEGKMQRDLQQQERECGGVPLSVVGMVLSQPQRLRQLLPVAPVVVTTAAQEAGQITGGLAAAGGWQEQQRDKAVGGGKGPQARVADTAAAATAANGGMNSQGEGLQRIVRDAKGREAHRLDNTAQLLPSSQPSVGGGPGVEARQSGLGDFGTGGGVGFPGGRAFGAVGAAGPLGGSGRGVGQRGHQTAPAVAPGVTRHPPGVLALGMSESAQKLWLQLSDAWPEDAVDGEGEAGRRRGEEDIADAGIGPRAAIKSSKAAKRKVGGDGAGMGQVRFSLPGDSITAAAGAAEVGREEGRAGTAAAVAMGKPGQRMDPAAAAAAAALRGGLPVSRSSFLSGLLPPSGGVGGLGVTLGRPSSGHQASAGQFPPPLAGAGDGRANLLPHGVVAEIAGSGQQQQQQLLLGSQGTGLGRQAGVPTASQVLGGGSQRSLGTTTAAAAGGGAKSGGGLSQAEMSALLRLRAPSGVQGGVKKKRKSTGPSYGMEGF